jgi:hypothetical protein
MKRVLAAGAIAIGVLLATNAAAQAPQAATPAGAPTATIDSVREAARTDRRGLVEKNMQLGTAEAKVFWPLYDSYQKQLGEIVQRQNRVVLDYVNAESNLTDANAKRIARELLAADADEQKLRERTMRKMLGVLPAKKAVRFLQIENKLRTLQRFDIAERIPLVR